MTKEDFTRLSELKRTIPATYEKVVLAHQRATSITSVLTGMPRSGNATSMVENCVIKAEMLLQQYIAMIKELKDIEGRLKVEAREKLSDDDRKIIIGWYCLGKKMTEIAKEIGQTERHVYRRRKEAYQKLIT